MINIDFSVLVAQILALVYLAAGVGALTSKPNYIDILGEFEKSRALTYVTGFVALVLGMIMVHYHNLWVADWTVIITLFGWAALIKGVMMLSMPQVMPAFRSLFKHTKTFGLIAIILGLFFAYFGFVA